MKTTERSVEQDVGPRSPRWCLMRHSLYYFGPDDLYMSRFRFLGTPLFGVMLHVIHRPDKDQVMHDHPWPFGSFVLWGTYTEEVPMRSETYARVNRIRKNVGLRVYRPTDRPPHTETREVRWFNAKGAQSPHRIVNLSRKFVVSLVFTGPRARKWGFYTSEGWVDEAVFLDRRKKSASA